MPHTNSDLILSFILLLIIATFTAYYARRKGRNPLIWFVVGVLLGIFAPLILLFFPSVKRGSESVDNGTPSMKVSQPDSSHRPPQAPSEEPELKRREEEEKLWYYLDQNHQQIGPVSIVALRELWNRGKLELNSYVWSEGMEQWERVENLPELKVALNKQ